MSRDAQSEEAVYRMDHPRRGVAAIFNHQVFDNSSISPRVGSEEDVQGLTWSFQRLGFQVELYQDLRIVEIEERLKELSGRDHSDCDSFVLIFMSHGNDGRIRCRDYLFDVNLLWDKFTDKACPSLANKPKIFILQACQGPNLLGAINVYTESPGTLSQDDSNQVKLMPSYQLPQGADFLLALSSTPGIGSWRYRKVGTFFILKLCHILNRHGFEMDLLTLMTRVSLEVAVNASFLNRKTNSYNTQQPSFISLLLRKVKFTRKPGTKCSPIQRKIMKELREEDTKLGSLRGTLDNRVRKRRRKRLFSRDIYSVSPLRKKSNNN